MKEKAIKRRLKIIYRVIFFRFRRYYPFMQQIEDFHNELKGFYDENPEFRLMIEDIGNGKSVVDSMRKYLEIETIQSEIDIDFDEYEKFKKERVERYKEHIRKVEHTKRHTKHIF
jgi:predicted transcriptional regulator